MTSSKLNKVNIITYSTGEPRYIYNEHETCKVITLSGRKVCSSHHPLYPCHPLQKEKEKKMERRDKKKKKKRAQNPRVCRYCRYLAWVGNVLVLTLHSNLVYRFPGTYKTYLPYFLGPHLKLYHITFEYKRRQHCEQRIGESIAFEYCYLLYILGSNNQKNLGYYFVCTVHMYFDKTVYCNP